MELQSVLDKGRQIPALSTRQLLMWNKGLTFLVIYQQRMS